MAFTNSKLVNYTKISPNKTPNRNHAIDTVTIHCVVGQVTVESLGEIFASPSKQASSNYGIGKDGKVGLYVEEKDRSWCSSNAANDHRAVTIEVASDTTEPYKVTNEAYRSLIRLLADICKRNGIKELRWCGDETLIGQVDKQNMTVHRWFANKSCPGQYLYGKHYEIADETNNLLKGGKLTTKKGDTGEEVFFLQQRLNVMRKLLKLRFDLLEEDGVFGRKTDDAVVKFQKSRKIPANGIVNQRTWDLLDIWYGDVNVDERVTAADAKKVLKAAVGKEKLTSKQKAAADMDADGKITAADAQEILKRSVGK